MPESTLSEASSAETEEQESAFPTLHSTEYILHTTERVRDVFIFHLEVPEQTWDAGTWE